MDPAKIGNSYLQACPPVINLVIQEIKMLLLLLELTKPSILPVW